MSDTPRSGRDAADKAFQDSLEQLRFALGDPQGATGGDRLPQSDPTVPPAPPPAAAEDIDQSLESAVADIEAFLRRPHDPAEAPED